MSNWSQGLEHLLNAFGHVLDHSHAKQAEAEAEREERRRQRSSATRTQRTAGFAGEASPASCCIAKRKLRVKT